LSDDSQDLIFNLEVCGGLDAASGAEGDWWAQPTLQDKKTIRDIL